MTGQLFRGINTHDDQTNRPNLMDRQPNEATDRQADGRTDKCVVDSYG